MSGIYLSRLVVPVVMFGVTAVTGTAVAIDAEEVLTVCSEVEFNRPDDPESQEACLKAVKKLSSQPPPVVEATLAPPAEEFPASVPAEFEPIPTDLRPGSRTREAVMEHLRSGRGGDALVEFEIEDTRSAE